MVFQLILLLVSITTFVNAVSLAKPLCQACCGNISIPYPSRIGADSGPALPLGQLGHCLRPLSGRGPPNFENDGVVEKNKK